MTKVYLEELDQELYLSIEETPEIDELYPESMIEVSLEYSTGHHPEWLEMKQDGGDNKDATANFVPGSILKSNKRRGLQDPHKSVGFEEARFRFYSMTVGESCPTSGGPPVGLGWDWNPQDDVRISVEDLEEFRGGNIPEDQDELEEEEWDDNWRTPREYFHEDGLLTKGKRAKLLRDAGVATVDVDLSGFLADSLQKSRKKSARDTYSRHIMNGADVDDIYELYRSYGASETLVAWARRRLAARGHMSSTVRLAGSAFSVRTR